MDPASIIADATAILNIANLAVQAAQDATPFIESAISVLQGNALTDAQRQANIAQEATLRAQLDAPSIPADQP